MKVLSALLAVALLVLVAAFFHEHHKATDLQASLVTLGKDREAMTAELRKLTSQVADLERRTPSKSAGTSEGARAASAARTSDPTPPVTTEPVARPGVTVKAPAGWAKNGAKAESYVVGVDSTQTWGGMPSAYVESRTPTVDGGFGGMMQTTSAENFAGKRVQLSGWIKTEDANEGGGHLWLRIDGQERGQMLGFDNMGNRAVKGTSDWQEASVVLDVPAGASSLNYGFFVSGGGKMWVNGQRIEVVGPEVPSTNMVTQRVLPKTPNNLGFDPNRPK